MARAARSRPAARKAQTKSGTSKASPLPGRGTRAGKTAAKKSNGKAKVVEAEEDEEDDDLGDDPVRDNSDDSDYQTGSEDDGSSEDEDADQGDDDDDDSDFETARKTKRSSWTAGKPTSARKKLRATTPSAPNGAASGSRNGVGARKGSKTGDTAASSVANANVAVGAAASATGGASAGYGGGGSSATGAGGTGGEAAPVKVGNGPAMRYVCEIAKSGRALCRRCDEKISKDALKVGVVTEGSWGPSTQWHHMQCTIFQVATAEEVEGFADLDDAVQPLLEQQVIKSQGEADDMYEPITPDDLVRQEWTEKAKCPDGVMATLLPYQAEGLAWMLNQEKLPYKGGILADEMGMGKTLQAICTLVANLPNVKDKTMQKRWAQSEDEMGQGGASAGSRGGTLVVCPTIALKQWQSELARFVKPGILKVVIHHGAKRATLAEDLVKADVVLTTYAIVENEHRKAYAGNKVACPDCGRTLYPDKMFTHRKYFCGESAQRTEAQAKTQRKGGAPWRRKDQGKKGKKGKKGDLNDSDNGTTEINIKVKGKGEGGGRSTAKGAKRKGAGKKGHVESDEWSDDSAGKTPVRVKSSARASRASSASKGKRKSKAPKSSEGEDSSEDAQTSIPSASKRGKSARGGKGRSSGRGKANRRQESEKDEDEGGGTTDIAKNTRGGKGTGGGKAKGKGKRKRKGGGESDSDFEGTTDISSKRNKLKGKKKRPAKSKGPKKRAAGDSGSEWTSSGDDSSSSSGDESDERTGKEAAFAKVLKEMMQKRDNAEPGVLQEISWQRIILDEAHFIKDRSTSTAKAVFALTSLYKWCLTGTPLQNRVGELYSLVRFLRLDPHAFYQCRSKGCDCKSLNYRFGPEWRACEECGHTPIMHYANFNRHILNPISRTGYVGEGKKAFLRLKREVLDQILLRRTKSNRSNDICLPPRIVRVRQHRLDEREEDFYQALYTQSQAQFDTYVGSGTILNNYAHIFDILIRLRQAVDHPYLVIYSATKREGMTPAMNSPAGQTPAASPVPPATTPPPRTPAATSSALMPPTVEGGTNGKPSSRPTRASKTNNGSSGGAGEGEDGGGGGGGGDGSPPNKEGGGSGALGDTSSDSESESDGIEAATGKGGAVSSAVEHEVGDEDSEEDMDACGICSEPAEHPVSSACGHSFCRACVQELIDTAPGDVECPTCSEPLTVDLSGGSPGSNEDEAEDNEAGGGRGRKRKGAGGGDRGRSGSRGRGGTGRGRSSGSTNDGAKGRMARMVATLAGSVKKTMNNKEHASSTGFKNSVTKHSVINRIDLSKFQTSTKMEALMEEVHLMQERDPAAKALVFSQFVNMLDLIEYRLHKGQVGCRKLSGHLSVDKRAEVLEAFQNDAGVKVLLISLKAGGVALNLTVANHIFLMDPWWNPAAEMQAIDRTHRLGQFKPIYATRFIIEDTVEERIIKLQEKKQLVFDSTVGGDAVSTGKLTVDDLRFLFAH